jgi:hypothetical protein
MTDRTPLEARLSAAELEVVKAGVLDTRRSISKQSFEVNHIDVFECVPDLVAIESVA